MTDTQEFTFDGFAVTLTGNRRDNGPWPIVEVKYTATGLTEWVPEGNVRKSTPLGKYTVLFNDGIGGGALGPEAPDERNTTDTLADAQRMFRTWLRDSGNDYTRAEGYGAPWADVAHTANWDGVSYGDITGGDGVCRFERGPRGGIIREEF